MTNQTVKDTLNALINVYVNAYFRPFKAIPTNAQGSIAVEILRSFDIECELFGDKRGAQALMQMLDLVPEAAHERIGKLFVALAIEQSDAERKYNEALEAHRAFIDSPENRAANEADRLNDALVDIAGTRLP